ncbi:hypothetical protein BJ165DRAFT_1447215 [Panaeolus papilionaceus]|nr:hypothetical protein BJ165DRAFT_1447215 [Panaeolus papilionaceus]
MSISFDPPALLGSAILEQTAQHVWDEGETPASSMERVHAEFVILEDEEVFQSGGTLGSTFWFRFRVCGKKYVFAGRFSQQVPSFYGSAIVCFKNPSQLHGRFVFTGHIGPTGIAIRLSNGVSITGVLTRRLCRARAVAGHGCWSHCGY